MLKKLLVGMDVEESGGSRIGKNIACDLEINNNNISPSPSLLQESAWTRQSSPLNDMA